MKSVSSGTRTTKITLPSSGSKSIRTGPTIIKGNEFASQANSRATERELIDNRARLRDTHLKDFKTEEDFNDWADYLHNYKSYTGKDLTFPAQIQSEGVGGAIAKGGSRAVTRALPSIFRQMPNFEGPLFITAPVLQQSFRNRAYPDSFRDMTPAQIQQYAFGPAHSGTEFKDGEGTLADYIQSGGNPSNPEVRPFLDLFRAETTRQSTETLQDIMNRSARDAAQVPLPPAEEDIPEIPASQVEQKADTRPRSQTWTDMWKNTKNKPAGGQSKNGQWRNEFSSVLEGETIPDRNSAEYPSFLEKLRQKFYKTQRGASLAPGVAIPSVLQPAPATPAQMAPVQPGNVPIVDAGLNLPPVTQQPANLPIGVQPGPPLRLQPTQPNQVARRPPNGPPEPSRGPGGQVARGGRPITTRRLRMPPPIIPLGGPDSKPKGPDKPEIPRDKFPKKKDPRDPANQDPDQETQDVDQHKMQSSSGYGYIRPEFSTDTGAESLILTDKQLKKSLTQWDKFDEVTEDVYSKDNNLYMLQVKKDMARFSGCARDPYCYLKKEYAKHNAKDNIKIVANQTSKFSANNLETALGQVGYNPFILAGSRERGIVQRETPDFEKDTLERLYENPDMEAQIANKVNYVDKGNFEEKLLDAMESASAFTLKTRWTTPTSTFEGYKNGKELNKEMNIL